jgi:hypothetical protein
LIAVATAGLTACSQTPGKPSPAAGGTPSSPAHPAAAATGEAATGEAGTGRPEPTPPAPTVDANPSDPPAITTIPPGGGFLYFPRKTPTFRGLPADWDSATWISRIRAAAAAGQHASKRTLPGSFSFPGMSVVSWNWSSLPAVKSFTVQAGIEVQDNVTNFQCTAQGFDPGHEQVAQQVARLFALCASAAFPGAQPAVAERWVSQQESLVLADLRSYPHAAEIMSATPSFGTGIYWVEANYQVPYGDTVQLGVM